ncbi:MAG: hypothetical protein M1830_007661, partial [Pleopsidium flavum]
YMGLVVDDTRADPRSDGAWHNFYIRPNPKDKIIVKNDWQADKQILEQANDENKNVLQTIGNNLLQASKYPFDGRKNGKPSKAQRVSFRCKEEVHNVKICGSRPVAAYTSPQSATLDNTWITFCPVFFDKSQTQLADATAKGPKKSDELYALRTREHIMAHEFMHCDKFGYPETIIDMSDSRVGGSVYGGSRCQEFGWINEKANPSAVNTKAVLNGT